MTDMGIIEQMESEVRGYCRSFPAVFATAQGSQLYDAEGNGYLDFFAGAGVLSYGHNHPLLKRRLLDYLERNGVVHSLDMATEAKEGFLDKLQQIVFEPRKLSYKVQFPGPTGTNAVEAALKLARKVTGRQRVLFFTNSFHGMTLGSLSVTGNAGKRAGAGVPLPNATPMPFDGYLGDDVDTLDYLEAVLEDTSSGVDKPAAVIVETVQAEGGINVARFSWLRRLQALLEKHGVLLIVDDVQVGCGRTGPFFSFEPAGIEPDIVCLSKALSGYGLPLALVLMKPEHDVWEPGEHNGTFRGHNPAFVTAAAALDLWRQEGLTPEIEAKATLVRNGLEALAKSHPDLIRSVRGRGLIQGVELIDDLAVRLSEACFQRGLIIETSGPSDEVLKLLPPLTTTQNELTTGLDIIASSLDALAQADAA